MLTGKKFGKSEKKDKNFRDVGNQENYPSALVHAVSTEHHPPETQGPYVLSEPEVAS